MINFCFFKPGCLCDPGPAEPDYFDLLPDGAITDILSRLPTQQLLRCYRVCRRWRSLLGTPGFAQEHEKRDTASQVPLVYVRAQSLPGEEQETVSLQLFFLRDREAREKMKVKRRLFQSLRLSPELKEKMSWPDSVLRATYNGLLLFEVEPFDSTYCILNPLTQEAVTFKNSDRVCGLYFHPPEGQYRLLCYRVIKGTRTGMGKGSFLYYVCSTGQELLKELGTFYFKPDIFPVHRQIDIPGMAANKGFLYWLVYKYYGLDRYMMRFDVVNEILELRPHPKGPPGNDGPHPVEHSSTRLFEMGDRLYAYMTTVDSKTRDAEGWEVWVLEDNASWCWGRVFVSSLPDRGGDSKYMFRVPLTIEDEQLVFLIPPGVFRTSPDHPIGMRPMGDGRRKQMNKILARHFSMVNWRRSFVSFRDYL